MIAVIATLGILIAATAFPRAGRVRITSTDADRVAAGGGSGLDVPIVELPMAPTFAVRQIDMETDD